NNLNNFSKHVKVQLRENSWTLLLYIYILLTFWNTSTVFYFLLDLISTLLQVETWLEIAKKLMPDGRIIVNCGGADAAVSLANDTGLSSWVQNSTIKALCAAFPGQLNWKRLSEKESVNYVALTGPLPNLDEWSTSVPSEMSTKVKQWVPCELA
ncbi:Os03g0126300, partial [Oryza sativa Japonica Group]